MPEQGKGGNLAKPIWAVDYSEKRGRGEAENI